MPHYLSTSPRLSSALLCKAASLSKSAEIARGGPSLFHSLSQEHSSVLSLAADDRHIFTGSQDGQICVSAHHTGGIASLLRRCFLGLG